MDSVPTDFKRFVKNVEEHLPYKKIDFTTLKELTASAKYFYEKAVSRPASAAMFAEIATKIYYLTPLNGESQMTFRKALITESQKNSEELRTALCTDDKKNLHAERSYGIYVFFGELFNQKFIFPEVLERHLGFLEKRKDKCEISQKCFYSLTSIVKERVVKLHKEENIPVLKSLLDTIENAEKSQTKIPKPERRNSKPYTKSFPILNGSSKSSACSTSGAPLPSTSFDKTASFISILEELTPKNSTEIIKKIESKNDKLRFEDGTWQLYYVILIEKALSNCELAEAIVDICQKLPRSSTDAWQAIKIEEYKRFIHNFINQKLEKLLIGINAGSNDQQTKSQIKAILNLIEKLLEQSLYSIGHVKSIIDVLLRCAQSNTSLTPPTLITLMILIKNNMNCSKIRKLPEEDRKLILKIINIKKGERKHAKNIRMKVKDIADYIDLHYEIEDECDESSTTEAETDQAGALNTNQNEVMKTISPIVSPQKHEYENRNQYSRQVFSASPENSHRDRSEVCQKIQELHWNSTEPSAALNLPCINDTYATLKDEKIIKVDMIPSILSRMNINDIDDCIDKIVSIGIKDIEDVQCLVVAFLRQSTFNFGLATNYAKLASRLQLPARTKNGEIRTFKILLADHCQHKFLLIFKNRIVPDKAEEVKILVNFISELIKLEVIHWDFVAVSMDKFFSQDTSCAVTECIEILMKAIGHLLEVYDPARLNRYFKFFETVVLGNENSFRSKIYGEIMDLRQNNWLIPTVEPKLIETSTISVNQPNLQLGRFKAPVDESEAQIERPSNTIELQNTQTMLPTTPTPLERSPIKPHQTEVELKLIVINFNDLEDREEMESVVADLRKCLTSSRLMRSFIATLLSRSSTNHQHILSINKLFKYLADFSAPTKTGDEITFKECLIEAFTVQFVKFNSKQTMEAGEETAVAALVLMVGEMYRQDIFSDGDLATWLVHQHIKKVPLQHLTYLSSIIQAKVQAQGGKHIKFIFGIFESTIHKKMMDMYSSIKNDINELAEAMQNPKRQ